MKQLCVIITGLSTAGAEMMLARLLQRIDRSQFSPTVISLTTASEVGPRLEALGIPVHALGMTWGVGTITRFMRLVLLLRKLKPDVVHTWMYHADLIGGLAARLSGIRVLTWGVRQSNLSPAVNKRSTLLVMKICALFSAYLPKRIASCSKRGILTHVGAGYREDKMVFIPNGFDLEHFQPDPTARGSVRDELGLAHETTTIGLVGRDDAQKNLPGFIEASARVHRAMPDVHFILVGAGLDRDNEALTSLIKQARLEAEFHLLGRREDIPRLMASLDLLASSSHGEAFPNVIGEAMSCGVPCVVTDAGDAAEIVGDTGRVVQSSDMTGMAHHLIELLHLPVERRRLLGARARNRIRDCYEIGNVTRLYEQFYIQLMEDH